MNRLRIPLAALALSAVLLGGLALTASPARADAYSFGGWSWLYMPQLNPPGITGFAAAGNTLSAVASSGAGAAAYDSTDGGTTWFSGSITPPPSQSPLSTLNGVTFSSPTHGWAVGGGPGGGGVAVTTDGGLTWNEQVVTTIGGNGCLYSASFVSDREGWVAGYDNPDPCVYHTTDGGGTWTPEVLPTDIQAPDGGVGQTITSIEFPDATHGWLLTDGGWVLYTTDGGADWRVLTSGSVLERFLAQSWLDPQHGWLVTGWGSVLGTTDGSIWATSSQVSPEYPLTGVAFGDALHGWAVSQNVVYATNDGGATWQAEGVSPWAVKGVVATSASHAYLWGASGVVETTTAGRNPDDTTPPTLTLSKPAGTWFNHDVTVTLVASDAGGISMKFAGLDGAREYPTSAITVSTSDGQGLHTVTGAAVDNAGNACATVSVSVGIDTMPTVTTASGCDANWHRTPVAVHFSATDNAGGSGVAYTEYSTDGGTSWTQGTSLIVPAPANHSGDGVHTVLYRAADNAGNLETAQSCQVRIDTRGPACAARNVTTHRDKTCLLYFSVHDALSPRVTTILEIKTPSGTVKKRWSWGLQNLPGWWSIAYRCGLARGTYHIRVYGTDLAGNPQSAIGKGLLYVR